ncbi:unnamed protein product [Microthlaspi erraticum]|uniref:Retrotransposon gag domain-containing protein n=1 Tax=Microthlaspi erraticum TaxID=1685480 RepID=A0A6D2HI67_9BRAS|nr:unnamed protein product [Microthlaspi erraticum]
MARRQSDCLTKYLLNTYATPFQCVADGLVARGCSARGRGCLRPWRPGPRSWYSGGFGRECAPSVATASVTQSVSMAAIGSFSASGSTGGSGSTPVAVVQHVATDVVQPGAAYAGVTILGVYGTYVEAAVGRREFWTWGDFLGEFNAKYFPRQARERLQMRFMDIEQGSRSVREYDAEFSRLLVHAGFGMEAEHQLTNRFLEGFRKDIRTLCRSSMHRGSSSRRHSHRTTGPLKSASTDAANSTRLALEVCILLLHSVRISLRSPSRNLFVN